MNFTRTKPYALLFLPVGLLCWFCVVQYTKPGQLPPDEIILSDAVITKAVAHDDGNLPPKADRAKHPKIILFWTSFFGGKNSYLGEEGERLKICIVSECIMTDDRSLWNTSDALIFHPLDFNPSDVPPVRHAHQYYIYFVLESPHHSNAGPPGFFNLTFTYRLDSDIIADNYLQYFRPSLWTKAEEFDAVWRRKTRGIAMFASNCGAPSDRSNYVKLLQRYIPVDVYGSCGTMQCTRDTKEKCDNLVGEYKFYLAFENSICRDYITEKAIRPYAVDTVPIFLSGANYSHMFPTDSFIDVQDFKSPKHLARHLQHLSHDKDAYSAYFRFRYRTRTNPHNGLPPRLAPDNVSLCKLCEMLHAKKRVRKFYPNLEDWWVKQADCKQPQWNTFYKDML
ncbi:putative Glycoprotein 3-alpha-L-fucosyltransferase A [Hypsibius exemplaris]|uniref:Fucosyltransferase n=1 Tax=Hypsibius exemplaris TaxID=2072580 RepID=A0A9X6NJ46_HYPEX|nr:putative Glycoprotein 3-alpha-L-fucosyltransferase A [Hypsibius exemplaris]